jgi:hypothetical protein
MFGCGGLRFNCQVISAGKLPEPFRLKRPVDHSSIGGQRATFSKAIIQRVFPFVPILCLYNRPKAEDSCSRLA